MCQAARCQGDPGRHCSCCHPPQRENRLRVGSDPPFPQPHVAAAAEMGPAAGIDVTETAPVRWGPGHHRQPLPQPMPPTPLASAQCWGPGVALAASHLVPPRFLIAAVISSMAAPAQHVTSPAGRMRRGWGSRRRRRFGAMENPPPAAASPPPCASPAPLSTAPRPHPAPRLRMGVPAPRWAVLGLHRGGFCGTGSAEAAPTCTVTW